MDRLSLLLSSRVKAQILRLLFGVAAPELHLREIARRAGLNDATVRQELRRLAALDLVEIRKDGNRSYVRAKSAHPLFAELRGLVLKTSGLVDVLREALDSSDIRVAFVFGSVAAGTERAHSDVDLMVIGSVPLRQLSARLSGVTERIGREVNPHAIKPEEFAKRARAKDHFVSTVLAAPKLFVIGGDRELAGVGG
jgi:predicted nucleotidyltransferase